MGAKRLPPSRVAYSAEFTPIVWVDLRGRELVQAFAEWVSKERPHILSAVRAGGCSGDSWSHGYSAEDAARIRVWLDEWSGKKSVPQATGYHPPVVGKCSPLCKVCQREREAEAALGSKT